MNDRYAEIKAELELMKSELEKSLKDSVNEEFSEELRIDEKNYKQKVVHYHIKEDLRDVERALVKLDYDLYGICEETGQEIPIENLKILPTARSVYDFVYTNIYHPYGSQLHSV